MATPAWLLALLLTSVHSVPLSSNEECGYKGCPRTDPRVLSVHIVPHSHDDVGWLKTVDQYYYGSKNGIQKAGVQYILDSVVKELWEDPKRKFIYVETAFFWKWWVRQSAGTQGRVRALVQQGRLVFVGGAWSMNDEAAVHYQSTADQFTWGLSKLNATFGPCALPRAGWQIDPFGHSREFAAQLALMGYDGLFLGRVDFQDKAERLAARSLEMLWRGDDQLGAASDIFTSVLYNTYSPPPGFCFDVLCSDEPIVDDIDSPMYNVDDKVGQFVSWAREAARRYLTANLLVTMGGDFTYQDANMWYTNLDKLIKYTNLKAAKERLNIKLFYSTPNCYLKAVKQANPILPIKQDDFFPYASDGHSYWTGYFTSRPTTKYFERQGNDYLQMSKQLQVLTGLQRDNQFMINDLKSAMGVWQHHDAVTGTEKQHVTHDYERMLHNAIENALVVPRQAFTKVLQGGADVEPLLSYERCRLNESSCFVSENSNRFVVTLYNPVAWSVNEAVRVPVRAGTYEVYAPNGDKIISQLVDIPQPVLDIPTRKSSATHEVVFIAYLKGLKYKSFFVQKLSHSRYYPIKAKQDDVKTEHVNKAKPDVTKHKQVETVEKQEGHKHKQTETIAKPDGHKHKQAETIDKQAETIAKQDVNKYNQEEIKPKHHAPKSKRDVKFIQPKQKFKNHRLLDTYQVNDYWKEAKENTDIEIKNIESELELERSERDKDIKIPLEPIKFEDVIPQPIDLDVLKDSDHSNIDIHELDVLIKEAGEKIATVVRERERLQVYPKLNEEEMRMLADEPSVVERTDDHFLVQNEHISLMVDNSSGAVRGASFHGRTSNFSITFGYYAGEVGNNEIANNRSSGAYILRTKSDQPTEVKPEDCDTVYGKVVSEVRVRWSDNVHSSARLYSGAEFIEVDWLVGPIDVEDDVGKEYVVKYQTNLVNNGEFFTDSNGRQSIKRKLNERPQWNLTLSEPVGGNYYPVTNEIYIQDDKEQITVLTDRSQGGTSLVEGEIELMLHRRLLHDDAFGVGEALNETANGKGLVVRGTHRIMNTELNNASVKKHIIQMHLKPIVFISDAGDMQVEKWFKLKNCYSWLKTPLPEGIHLLTLEPWGEKLLLRLENYLTGKSVLEVDLTKLLNNITVKAVKETGLSANEMGKKWTWETEEEFSESFNEEYGSFEDRKRAVTQDEVADDGLVVKLTAKQIRTFIVDYVSDDF